MQVKRNATVARGVEEAYGFIHDIVEVQYHGHPDLRQVVVPVEEVRLLLNEVGKGQQWDCATLSGKQRNGYARITAGSPLVTRECTVIHD